MITLTTPAQINSVLGGNTPIGYDHLVLAPFTMDPFTRKIEGTIRLTSTTNPEMETVFGRLSIDLGPGVLVVRVEQVDLMRRIQLTPGQITAVQNILNNAQNALEGGLITVGVVAGAQSAGA